MNRRDISEVMEKEKIINLEDYEILTPDGFKNFDGIKTKESENNLKIIFENNFLICTFDHPVFSVDRNEYVESCDLNIGEYLKTKNGKEKIIDIIFTKEKINVVDFLNVSDNHCYYTNDVVSHNCHLLFLDEVAFVPENEWKNFTSWFILLYPQLEMVR